MADIELKGLKGLRDLESLVSDSKSKQRTTQNLQCVAIELLHSGRYQPRNAFPDEQLLELAASVKSQGIIQPLIVRQVQLGQYEIIAGERRWRAAKIAELKEVPVIVRNICDNTALAFALIENIQRENLNPIDEALGFARLRDEFMMSHTDIAEIVGRSRVAVTNILRLLSLDETVKDWLKAGKLEMGHARALLALTEHQQINLARKIIDNRLSVREAEGLVGLIRSPNKQKLKRTTEHKNGVEYWVNALTRKFSRKVDVRLNGKGTGKVIIHIDSLDEIDWLIEHVKIQ